MRFNMGIGNRRKPPAYWHGGVVSVFNTVLTKTANHAGRRKIRLVLQPLILVPKKACSQTKTRRSGFLFLLQLASMPQNAKRSAAFGNEAAITSCQPSHPSHPNRPCH